jgi:hypothetical protein
MRKARNIRFLINCEAATPWKPQFIFMETNNPIMNAYVERDLFYCPDLLKYFITITGGTTISITISSHVSRICIAYLHNWY